MLAQGQADMGIVLDHPRPAVIAFSRTASSLISGGGRPLSLALAANSGNGSSRSALMAHSASRRACPNAGRNASASANFHQRGCGHAGTAPEVIDIAERLPGAGRDNGGGIGIGETETRLNPSRTAKR